MQIFQRKQVRLLLGIAGASAVIMGLYKLWKFLSERQAQLKSKEDETQSEEKNNEESEDQEEHVLFQQGVQDKKHEVMGKGQIGLAKHLRDINYRIILSLTKGSSYQGIVNINFQLDYFPSGQDYFPINYNGLCVKFLLVNGYRFDPRDVNYREHRILLPKQLLKQKSKNNIQIIFDNSYSFLNEGLSAYFILDESHKYSLRQQVIYSSNGYLEVQKIFPCINCLNECKLQVQVIHPDTFQVFSNSSKSLERYCSVTQYYKYPFLFEYSSNSLNRSIKLNSSTISSASGFGDNSSQYSSSNVYNRKKANTHFYPTNLPSIHNFHIFSSSMTELQPATSKNSISNQIMIRYFCKHAQSHKISRNVDKVHLYILDKLRIISSIGSFENINKIDIIIIADKHSDGYFAPGIILMSQETLTGNLSIKCFYLIVRALVAIVKLAQGENIVTLREILSLNELVFNKFEQFRNYLYIKNQKYEKLKNIMASNDKKEYLKENEGFFLSYFSKQLKYLLTQNIQKYVTNEFSSLMNFFKPQSSHQFWQNFMSNCNFLSPLIIDPLIKLAIKKIGVPQESKLRQQLKVCFNSSKYSLFLYSNQQISDNLPKFIGYQAFGLQQRLTQLKVKQKFKDFITQRYEKYLPVKSNIAQAEAIYNQFKKFNQAKNFHHQSLLKQQIKRVLCFGIDFIHPQRINLDCTISGWKLLQKLKIYPFDQNYYRFLKNFDCIQQI